MGLRIALWVVAVSQLVPGVLTLLLPTQFLGWMGLSIPPADTGYMLAMLGARFIAYGVGMIWLARQPSPSRFWIRNMVLVQAIDFTAGGIYLAAGTVSLATAAFPMFNAVLFGSLLWTLSRPRPIAA